MVNTECLCNFPSAKNSDRISVDPAACPVVVVFDDYVLANVWFKDFCDGYGIALVDQAAVTVVGINDCPIFGIVECGRTMPPEAFKLFTNSQPLFGRRLQDSVRQVS
jgi:hypothetical protein